MLKMNSKKIIIKLKPEGKIKYVVSISKHSVKNIAEGIKCCVYLEDHRIKYPQRFQAIAYMTHETTRQAHSLFIPGRMELCYNDDDVANMIRQFYSEWLNEYENKEFDEIQLHNYKKKIK
jgi:hypothetical protein